MKEPPRWEQQFEFYEARMNDDRLLLLVDLDAAGHAPLASHPVRLEVRVPMLEPRSDGLRSSEEAAALFALEDTIVDRLGGGFGAIYVGRFIVRGNTTLVFYAPPGASVADALGRIGSVDPYRLALRVEADQEWSVYLEFLFPDPYAMQTIQNRRLLKAREEHGDRPEKVREVDHMVYFPSRAGAEEAAQRLTALGHRVDPIDAPDDGERWALQFHRDERLDEGNPDRFVSEILDVVLPLDGDYDGWGALIERDED